MPSPPARGASASANSARTRVETSGSPSAPRLISAMVLIRARTNGSSTVAPATPINSTPQNRAMPRSDSS